MGKHGERDWCFICTLCIMVSFIFISYMSVYTYDGDAQASVVVVKETKGIHISVPVGMYMSGMYVHIKWHTLTTNKE